MLRRNTSPLPSNMDPKGGGNSDAHFAHWLSKSLYYFYILVSFEIGLTLIFLPWMPFWDNNYLLYLYPGLRPVVSNDFFKGFVAGLGIINILIGINEIAQIRRRRKSSHPPE